MNVGIWGTKFLSPSSHAAKLKCRECLRVRGGKGGNGILPEDYEHMFGIPWHYEGQKAWQKRKKCWIYVGNIKRMLFELIGSPAERTKNSIQSKARWAKQ